MLKKDYSLGYTGIHDYPSADEFTLISAGLTSKVPVTAYVQANQPHFFWQISLAVARHLCRGGGPALRLHRVAGLSAPANLPGGLADHGDDAELNGTPNWSIGGTVYIPEGTLSVEGTPGTFANGLIAGHIEVRGTADITIDFQDQFPRLPRTVFLVE